jgi:acetyl/propionyl-CoA carboxylase alpha subunit
MANLLVRIDDREFEVDLSLALMDGDTYSATVNGEPVTVVVPEINGPVTEIEWLIINNRPYEIVFDPNLQWLNAWDGAHTVEVHDRNLGAARPRSGDGRIKAPIPGLISRILVEPGASVEAGQTLVVLEAMKMENEIRAPFNGVVIAVSVNAGQTVVRNQVLAEVQ